MMPSRTFCPPSASITRMEIPGFCCLAYTYETGPSWEKSTRPATRSAMPSSYVFATCILIRTGSPNSWLIRDSTALRIGRYISTMVVGLALVYTPNLSVTSAQTGSVTIVRPSARTSAPTLLRDILTSSCRGISMQSNMGHGYGCCDGGDAERDHTAIPTQCSNSFQSRNILSATRCSLMSRRVYGYHAPIDHELCQAYTAGIAIPEEEVHYAAANQQRLCGDPNTGL